MIEVDELQVSPAAGRRQRAGWLLNVFIRPARAFGEIAAAEKAAWWLPLLILTALTVIFVLVAGPLRQAAAASAQVEPPPNFEYMTPEQQQQYMAAQASASGTTQTVIFPLVGGLVGLWTSWFILGALLHLALTLLGGRGSNTTAFNLVAWASLPFALRSLVQIGYMLITHQLIAAPGVSGLIDPAAKGVLAYARVILGMVDLYLIWQIVLLWIGSAAASGLPRGKALGGVAIAVLILLVLAALPGFISAQMSGLNVDRPFFLF